MAEILASLSDINAHLPANVQINNDVDADLQVDALRLVRGQLVSMFTSAVLTSWDTPDDTPELIRSVAGRLIASKFYARIMSGESVDAMPDYAIDLYKQAIGMLSDIRSGVLQVVDDAGNVLSTDTGGSDPLTDVNPNDNSPGPVFTMDRVLFS